MVDYGAFRPPSGFYDDGTEYSAKGKWYRGNLVRFKEGFPQKMRGWTPVIGPFLGLARNLKSWTALDQSHELGIGTNLKYYVASDATLEDITPLRDETTLGANPFATVGIGNATIRVTDVANGADVGDFVTFSGAAGTFGGVNSANLNANWQIATIVDVDHYEFVGPTAATSVASGGGGAAEAAYEIHVGLATRPFGPGYGYGQYGEEEYGVPTSFFTAGEQLRTWSASNFGEDLIINPRGGGIYYWDTSAGGRAVDLSDLVGANETPVAANYVLVSSADRTVFAFGVNPIGEAAIDPLFIRWSNAESAAEWEPMITNSSGSLRLSYGSEIYTAAIAKGQILVWTESSLSALIYVGGDLSYGQQMLAPNIDILGPNAAVSVGDFAIWMGQNNFYIYDGSVRSMPCSVRQAIFSNINLTQAFKVYAGSNTVQRECWFLYPSSDSTENNMYVVYNYHEDCWYYGELARTAWCDKGTENYPQASGTDGYIYFQEYLFDDGSTDPPSPMDSYIESGPFELGDGASFVYMSRIIPDITFTGSLIEEPYVTYTVQARNWPGGPYYTPDTGEVIKTVSADIEQYTTHLDTRIRGRQYLLRIESGEEIGIMWRLGVQRFQVQQDGQR